MSSRTTSADPTRLPWKRAALGGLVALLIVSCGSPEVVGPTTPIVLISIDGLRADYVGDDGPVRTPEIDRLAAQGVRATNAWSATPLTLPSHVSMLTGLLPHLHGIRDERGYAFDGDRFPWLPSILQENGFATGGFVSSWPLSGVQGLSVGFDRWEALSAQSPEPRRSAAETLELVGEWLSEPRDGPFFLFVQIAEPNPPWTTQDAAGYGQAVQSADAAVGDLLDLVDTQSGPRAIVLLVADHGEGLGDGGEVGHGVLLDEATLRVPWILRAPGTTDAGVVRDDPVQLVDVLPTLLRRVGVDLPFKQSGQDLLDPEREAPTIYSETWFPRIHLGWSELCSLVSGHWHLVSGDRAELYDLSAHGEDAGRDRSLDERKLYASLRRELARYDQGFRAPEEIPEAERMRLARFGIQGFATQHPEARRPDPRDRLGSLRQLKDAWALYRSEELEAAIPAFEVVLQDNPWLLDVREARAEALLRSGRAEEAAEAFRAALRVSDGDPRLAALASRAYLGAGELDEALDLAHFLFEGGGSGGEPPQEILVRVGDALVEAGRAGEAVGLLRPLADDHRPAILAALAIAMAESGDLPGALTILQRLEELRPDEARTHEVLGRVIYRTGQLEEAEDRIRRALALDARRVGAWNLLGEILEAQGRDEEALRAWEQAREIDPKAWGIRWRLGLRAAELGRARLARSELEILLRDSPEAGWEEERAKARRYLDETPPPNVG